MTAQDRFDDRGDAGRRLAHALAGLGLDNPVVLALPRGGVPVAAEVARVLGVALDVFVARKVGAPGNPEFGIGAIAEPLQDGLLSDGEPSGNGDDAALWGLEIVMDEESTRAVGVDRDSFMELAATELMELRRRVERYRGDRHLPPIENRDVVLVDDGIATGVTAEVALRALGGQHPRRLVLAVPVCAPASAKRLSLLADDVVCLLRPTQFGAVGRFYRDFDQTTDAEVLELLARPESGGGQEHP